MSKLFEEDALFIFHNLNKASRYVLHAGPFSARFVLTSLHIGITEEQ